jgi:ER-bound oxygenase mpaB/B'/Rubber oxygenase, catalytic domain
MKTDNAFLDKNRLVGDQAADQLMEGLFKMNNQSELYAAFKLSEKEILSVKKPGRVLTFLSERRKQPSWYDEKRVVRGQQVFQSYATEMMTLLGAMALPYCYAASPGNKALYLSDKMRQSPGKRLLDTAQFIISVSTPGTLGPENHGHIHINKTRLIHAIARYYVGKGNWDMAWGLPINQEDMAGTNLAFSVLILLGLQQSGHVLSEKQKEDFIFLWRYIGYQLAIEEDLLPATFKEAYHLAQVIKKRNFKKSEEGVALAKELLSYYHSVAPSDKAYFIDAQIRHFLGPEVSGYIGLEPEYIKDKVTNLISSFNGLQNFFAVHTSSYTAMMENHRLLKMNLSKPGASTGK